MSGLTPSVSTEALAPGAVLIDDTGEKPRVRVKARSSLAVNVVSNYLASSAPISDPYDAASRSDALPRVQNIGPNDVSRFQRSIVAQARQLYRNQGDIRRGMRMIASAVVGIGPTINPRLAGMKKIWKAWCREADASGLRNFQGLLRRAYLAQRIDGEVILRLRPRYLSDGLTLPLQVEALEADHLPWEWTRIAPNGNRIVAGIELDKLNRRVAFWLTPFHPADSLARNLQPDTNLPNPVPAESVLFMSDPERLAGQRSESSLVAAITYASNLGIYLTSEQIRKNISTMYVGGIRRLPEHGGIPMPGEELTSDQRSAMISQIRLEPGILAELPFGTDIEWNEPPDTGSSFEPYLRFAKMYLASCVDASYEDFTGDWRGASDRSWRAGQVAFRTMLDSEHQTLEFQVLDPLYRRLVDLAIATGKIKRPPDMTDEELYEVRWTWPGSKNPNQYQEWNAFVLAITNGLMSRDEAIEANGGDPFEVDQRQAEGKVRAKAMDLFYPVYTPTDGAGGIDKAAAAAADPMSAFRDAIAAEVKRALDQRAAEQVPDDDEKPGAQAETRSEPKAKAAPKAAPRPEPKPNPKPPREPA